MGKKIPHLSVNTLESYIAAVSGYKRGTLYRGVGKKCHKLRPGIGRIGKHNTKKLRKIALNKEYRLIRNFQTNSSALVPRMDYTSLAVLAQHHGLPTRLLDWSYNPLVALFFAVRSHEDEDGKVFIAKIENYFYQSEIGYEKYILYQDEYWTRLFEEHEGGDDDHLSYQEFILNQPNINTEICVFKPICIDPRMTAQASVFTFHPDPFTPMRDGLLEIIDIPAEAKKTIRKMLERCGVHEFALFPDLDGLCRWLSDVFGANPPME